DCDIDAAQRTDLARTASARVEPGAIILARIGRGSCATGHGTVASVERSVRDRNRDARALGYEQAKLDRAATGAWRRHECRGGQCANGRRLHACRVGYWFNGSSSFSFG